MEQLETYLIDLAKSAGVSILYALLVLIVGMKLSKLIIKIITKGKLCKKLDESLRGFLKSFLTIVFDIVIFISVAVILGIPMTSFITVLASAGVAIGLALQGALSNFAGGLMILLFKPFKVGDYIEANGKSGTVKEINVFYTVLSTYDNMIITLPNGTLTNSAISNSFTQNLRRVDFQFSASYDSDIESVKALLLKEALSHKLVLKEPAPFARLYKHNQSSLDFVLRVWCKSSDYWDIYFDITESVKKSFDENNISIPYSQIDVHLDKKA